MCKLEVFPARHQLTSEQAGEAIRTHACHQASRAASKPASMLCACLAYTSAGRRRLEAWLRLCRQNTCSFPVDMHGRVDAQSLLQRPWRPPGWVSTRGLHTRVVHQRGVHTRGGGSMGWQHGVAAGCGGSRGWQHGVAAGSCWCGGIKKGVRDDLPGAWPESVSSLRV